MELCANIRVGGFGGGLTGREHALSLSSFSLEEFEAALNWSEDCSLMDALHTRLLSSITEREVEEDWQPSLAEYLGRQQFESEDTIELLREGGHAKLATAEKLSVLSLLCDQLLDNSEVRGWVTDRVEAAKLQGGQKPKKQVGRKGVKRVGRFFCRRLIPPQAREIESAGRWFPLGQDRDFGRYWLLPGTCCLYVEHGDGWCSYDTKEEIDALVESLDGRGRRESELKQNLLSMQPHIEEVMQQKEALRNRPSTRSDRKGRNFLSYSNKHS